MSYSRLEFSSPRLAKSGIGPDKRFTVDVDVVNAENRDGDEVRQLYVRDEPSSVPRPGIELKAFERITLRRGERRTVRFDLWP